MHRRLMMRISNEQIEQAIELLDRAQKIHKEAPPVCKPKVRKWLQFNVENPKVLIAVNKEVTAILVLAIGPDYFSTKKIINDLVFYSETAGSGFRLLKEGQEWVKSWGDSVHGAYFGTSNSDDKVDKMIERFGMRKIGSQYAFNIGENTNGS